MRGLGSSGGTPRGHVRAPAGNGSPALGRSKPGPVAQSYARPDRHDTRPDTGDVKREMIGQKGQRTSRGLLGHDMLADRTSSRTEQARSLDLTGGIATWPDG